MVAAEMEEGKPTGIKRKDTQSRAPVKFEGRELLCFKRNCESDGSVRLEFRDNSAGEWIVLYGYYGRGGEFFELDRDRFPV